MDVKTKLSERINMYDINEILSLAHDNDSLKKELYDLAICEDEKVGYQAAWILTHFSSQDNKWLYNKQGELIDKVLACRHGGKRRLILTLLYKQPLVDMTRIDFLDFCLERMISKEELPAVQSLCMKIAYELCLPIPELMQELNTMLEMMEADLTPAIRAIRKSILKAMQKSKSLQKLR
jgi:hypothetical protein